MKKYIVAICALLMAMVSQAETAYRSLLVTMTDGSETEFKFADTPVATFEGADMKITTMGGASSVTMPMTDVEKMTIIEATVNVTEVEDAARAVFVINDSEILGSGFEAGVDVALYSLDGMLVSRTAADDNGGFSLSVPAGAKGTYVVKAGSRSFKFIK